MRLSSMVQVRRRSELADARARGRVQTQTQTRGTTWYGLAERLSDSDWKTFKKRLEDFDAKIVAYCAGEVVAFLPTFKKECTADDLVYDWGSFYKEWNKDHGNDCTLCTYPTIDDYNNKWIPGIEKFENRYKAMLAKSGAATELASLPPGFGEPLPPVVPSTPGASGGVTNELSMGDSTPTSGPMPKAPSEPRLPIAVAGANATTLLVLLVATVAAIGGYLLLSKGSV